MPNIIERISGLLAKATAAPWSIAEKLSGSENHKGWSLWATIPDEVGEPSRCWLGDISPVIENEGDPSEQGKANAALIPELRNAAPALMDALRKGEAVIQAQSAMGGILVCSNPDHMRPLRHPTCTRCQLDARLEELEAALEVLK